MHSLDIMKRKIHVLSDDIMKRKIHVLSDHIETPGLPVVDDVMNCFSEGSHWGSAFCTPFLYRIVQDTCP
jgi:hypothetical protein